MVLLLKFQVEVFAGSLHCGFSSSKHLVNTVPSSHGKTTKVEHDTGCNHNGRSFFSLAINNNWGLKSRSTLDYKEIQKHMTGRQQSKMQHSSQATECAIIKTLDIFQKNFVLRLTESKTQDLTFNKQQNFSLLPHRNSDTSKYNFNL